MSASFSSRFLFCDRVTAWSFAPETPAPIGVWETGVTSGSNPTGVASGVETSAMTLTKLDALCKPHTRARCSKPNPPSTPEFVTKLDAPRKVGGRTGRSTRRSTSTCRVHFFTFPPHIARRTTWKADDALRRVHGWSCLAGNAGSDVPCGRTALVPTAPAKGCAAFDGGEKQKRSGTQSREAC